MTKKKKSNPHSVRMTILSTRVKINKYARSIVKKPVTDDIKYGLKETRDSGLYAFNVSIRTNTSEKGTIMYKLSSKFPKINEHLLLDIAEKCFIAEMQSRGFSNVSVVDRSNRFYITIRITL